MYITALDSRGSTILVLFIPAVGFPVTRHQCPRWAPPTTNASLAHARYTPCFTFLAHRTHTSLMTRCAYRCRAPGCSRSTCARCTVQTSRCRTSSSTRPATRPSDRGTWWHGSTRLGKRYHCAERHHWTRRSELRGRAAFELCEVRGEDGAGVGTRGGVVHLGRAGAGESGQRDSGRNGARVDGEGKSCAVPAAKIESITIHSRSGDTLGKQKYRAHI